MADAVTAYLANEEAALWPERVTPALARELPGALVDRLSAFCERTGIAARRVLRDGVTFVLGHEATLERVSVTLSEDLADQLELLSTLRNENVQEIVVAAVGAFVGEELHDPQMHASWVALKNAKSGQLSLFQGTAGAR
jgi:hypothetical protein